MSQKEFFQINGREVALSNLDKVYFPESNITKAELIDYYIQMAPLILPYLRDRPFSMLHYPDGIHGKTFYQKQRPEDAPEWLAGVNLPSNEKTIDWCLVNDLPSLVYMVNRSCIETHAWFSRLPELDKPDIAVFDLDPSGDTGYDEALSAALLAKTALDAYHISAFPKLSGKTGIHVVIPIQPTPYDEVRAFLGAVCKAMEKAQPEKFTTERTIAKRGDRIYLDAVQNARGKTIPSPYSVRSTPYANVSAPVTWEELQSGIRPEDVNLRNVKQRVDRLGDLFAPVYTMRQRLPQL